MDTGFPEKFTIRVKVYNSRGDEIPARTFAGDVGENISGEGRKKIHLLKGIAGYGLIGSAIVMRGNASDTYDNYRVETDLDRRDKYYREVESQLLASNLLWIGAGLVWASDYLTVIFGENRVLNRSKADQEISFQQVFIQGFSVPGFSMKITF